MSRLTESVVEDAAISWFEELGHTYLSGADIAPDDNALTPNPSPGGRGAKRADYGAVVLEDRLYDALTSINPSVPSDSIEEALRTITRTDSPNLILNNRNFHRMVVEGIDVSFRRDDRTVTEKVWLFDFDRPEMNDWLVVNPFTVVENHVNRRPDMWCL